MVSRRTSKRDIPEVKVYQGGLSTQNEPRNQTSFRMTRKHEAGVPTDTFASASTETFGSSVLEGMEIPDEDERTSKVVNTTLKVVLIAAGAVIAAICICLAILSGTQIFTVERLIVNGASHLTEIETVELAQIPEGTTLINVDTEAIRQRMLLDTWIEDVSVSRVFPDALHINVKERKINAVAEVPAQNGRVTRLWALAADGLYIMPIPDKDSEAGQLVNPQIYEDVETVLHIVDIPYGTTPEIGTYCADEYINNALNIVSNLSTDLSKQIVTVKATDAASTTLVLQNGIEIAFGTATDIRDKERVCLELMEKYDGQIAYINCSVVDDVTWRSI